MHKLISACVGKHFCVVFVDFWLRDGQTSNNSPLMHFQLMELSVSYIAV